MADTEEDSSKPLKEAGRVAYLTMLLCVLAIAIAFAGVLEKNAEHEKRDIPRNWWLETEGMIGRMKAFREKTVSLYAVAIITAFQKPVPLRYSREGVEIGFQPRASEQSYFSAASVAGEEFMRAVGATPGGMPDSKIRDVLKAQPALGDPSDETIGKLAKILSALSAEPGRRRLRASWVVLSEMAIDPGASDLVWSPPGYRREPVRDSSGLLRRHLYDIVISKSDDESVKAVLDAENEAAFQKSLPSSVTESAITFLGQPLTFGTQLAVALILLAATCMFVLYSVFALLGAQRERESWNSRVHISYPDFGRLGGNKAHPEAGVRATCTALWWVFALGPAVLVSLGIAFRYSPPDLREGYSLLKDTLLSFSWDNFSRVLDALNVGALIILLRSLFHLEGIHRSKSSKAVGVLTAVCLGTLVSAIVAGSWLLVDRSDNRLVDGSSWWLIGDWPYLVHLSLAGIWASLLLLAFRRGLHELWIAGCICVLAISALWIA